MLSEPHVFSCLYFAGSVCVSVCALKIRLNLTVFNIFRSWKYVSSCDPKWRPKDIISSFYISVHCTKGKIQLSCLCSIYKLRVAYVFCVSWYISPFVYWLGRVGFCSFILLFKIQSAGVSPMCLLSSLFICWLKEWIQLYLFFIAQITSAYVQWRPLCLIFVLKFAYLCVEGKG